MNFLKKHWKSGLIFVLIFYLSLIYNPPYKPFHIFRFQDKFIHIIMYFALSIAILLESGFRRISGTKLLLLLLIPVFYGGLIEILQGTCTTTRDADWFDFLSNITGVAFSFFILKIYYHRKAVFPK